MAVALLGVGFVVLGQDEDKSNASGQSSTTTAPDEPGTLPPAEDPDEPQSPSHGGIEIVESGGSNYFDSQSQADEYSYGVIIENTSDKVADFIIVKVDLLDASGNVIATEENHVVTLPPGERFGLGAMGIMVSNVAAIDVAVANPLGWADPAEFGKVTAEVVGVSFDSDGTPLIGYRAVSTYESAITEPFAHVIFRDANGVLVGGYNYFVTDGFVPSTGELVGEVATFDAFNTFDPARTEIYLDANVELD